MTAARRRRVAAGLRLTASTALLVAVMAFFQRPLAVVLGPALQRAGLASVFRGPAAPGFVLQVVSRPPGAAVWIDGVRRGSTPALLNVVCRHGDEVALKVTKEGYPEFRQSLPCRQEVPVRARIDLTR